MSIPEIVFISGTDGDIRHYGYGRVCIRNDGFWGSLGTKDITIGTQNEYNFEYGRQYPKLSKGFYMMNGGLWCSTGGLGDAAHQKITF